MHKLSLKEGLVDKTFDIFILNLKDNELANQNAFYIRNSEVFKNEKVSVYGYPEAIGPYGSYCDFQTMYIASPAMFLSTRLTAEIFCGNSNFFGSFEGMSGGPIVDSDGFVVGIMSSQNLSKNVGGNRNYIQIVPGFLIKNVIDTKSNNLNKLLSFTDYGFSDRDVYDVLAQLSGYSPGTFVEIEKLGDYPLASIVLEKHQDSVSLSKIIYSFRKLNLQIELWHSGDNRRTNFSIKRISDAVEVENGTNGPSLELFRSIRRWLSKKIEQYTVGK